MLVTGHLPDLLNRVGQNSLVAKVTVVAKTTGGIDPLSAVALSALCVCVCEMSVCELSKRSISHCIDKKTKLEY